MATVLYPKTLADGHTALWYVPTLSNPAAPKITEITAGMDISCRVLKSDFRLSATDSDTVDDMSALCDEANSTVYGATNYEGNITMFRYFNAAKPGTPDPQGDAAFQALKNRGTQGYMVKRSTGKKYDAAFEAGDEVEVYSILTDMPQDAGDVGGYIRKVVPLGVQNGWQGTVAA